jgi:transposase-like protein
MPGRKIIDKSDALALLALAENSGMKRSAWARLHGIDARSLHIWSVILQRRASPSKEPATLRFVELLPSTPTPAPSVLRLLLGDLVVEVVGDVDEAVLCRVLRAARSC